MLKIILTSLILWQTAYSSDTLSYSNKKYSSGTPFIRLTVPESTHKWTCFDESMYGKVIDNAYQLQIKDSIIALSEHADSLCRGRADNYEAQIKLLRENESKLIHLSDTVFANYKTCNQDLKEQTFQKWIWGGLGSLVGVVVGAVVILVIHR